MSEEPYVNPTQSKLEEVAKEIRELLEKNCAFMWADENGAIQIQHQILSDHIWVSLDE